MADDEGWRRLGRRVRSERTRRWPLRIDFAAACGLGDRTVAAIENAERSNFKPATIEALELGLGWEYGGAERVRQGLQPLYVIDQDPNLARIRELWPRLSMDARRMLVDIAERSLR